MWKSYLKGNPVDWLLEGDNPAVRYLTLVDVLGASPSDRDVRKARSAVMEHGPVPAILAKQREGGYWVSRDNFYIKTKYRGTVWTVILLAELLADGRDTRVRGACETLLSLSQHTASGGFSFKSDPEGGGLARSVIPCLTGNLVWSFLRFGYGGDRRVRRGIDWIVQYLRFDDGDGKKPTGWPYEISERCWGRHSCYRGIVKSLKALAEIQQRRRTKGVRETIDRCVDYILKHRVYKRSHDPGKIGDTLWTQFLFPTLWDIDALEILLLLTGVGCSDDRMQDALDLLLSKQDGRGRWALERTFGGRLQVAIEAEGEPSKWVTLRALTVLKRCFG